MLTAGANDLGGTLMEETISRMAGSEHGSTKTAAEIEDIAAGIDRSVRERTTLYDTPTRRTVPPLTERPPAGGSQTGIGELVNDRARTSR